jgi:CheY-like chemotaxis protein
VNQALNEVEILLVEDNRYDAELTVRALKDNKLANRILLVRDGAEAIDFLFCTGEYIERKQENALRLIMLDLKLPKINGLEVLRQIKSDERTKAIPVVVLTSSTEERDMVESYNLGVNSYISKPVDFEKFIQAVQETGFYWLLLNKLPR